MKPVLALVLAGALVSSTTATMAHDGSLADSIDAPRAAEARVGFRVPLGGDRFERAKSTYGASLGMTSSGPVNERVTRTVAEFNFSGAHVEQARLGSVDFANQDTSVGDNRAGLFGLSPVVFGIGVVIGAWAAYELFNDDDDEEVDDTPMKQ